MFNYIRSELYHVFRKKNNYIFWLLCTGALLIVVLAMGTSEISPQSSDYYLAIEMLMSFGCMIFPIICAMCSSKRPAVHIQILSYGIKRHKVYLGDYIVNLIQMVVTAVVLLLLSIFFCWVATGSIGMNAEFSSQLKVFVPTLEGVIKSTFLIFLISASILPIVQFCVYFFQNGGLGVGVYMVLAWLIPNILFNVPVNDSAPFSVLIHKVIPYLPYCYALGLPPQSAMWIGFALHIVLWNVLGLYLYRRKEF